MPRPIVLVKGAGDLATGVIQTLHRAGFWVCATEIEQPTAIRRLAALSDACYVGQTSVEDIEAILCHEKNEVYEVMVRGQVAIVIDPLATLIDWLKPVVVVDAILAKRNLGTTIDQAPVVIGMGPGFTAGVDCHYAIETMRGHQLGRIIKDGSPLPNTGVPGLVAGHAADRVIHAPATGIIYCVSKIAQVISKGDEIAIIKNIDHETVSVRATIDGVIRGLIPDRFYVHKGLKICDIDARLDQAQYCDTISDKARSLGGSVLTAIFMGLDQLGFSPLDDGLTQL